MGRGKRRAKNVTRVHPAHERQVASEMRVCTTHGLTSHAVADGGRWRCRQCRVDSLARRRQERKAVLVAELGGKCVRCGYEKSIRALQFHHRNPEEKLFEMTVTSMTKPLDILRAEVKKCDLLCSNCHSEVEFGLDQARAKVRKDQSSVLVEEPGKLYGDCPTHGRAEFSRVKDGDSIRTRCKRCNVDAWQRWYWRTKDTLVEEAGGKCVSCGYDKYRGALEFHHRDSSEKEFALGKVRKSLDQMRAEVRKCNLLCSNCHAEHHATAAAKAA
jgi:5-methylcytosine-specific restriction endonuclease McrA